MAWTQVEEPSPAERLEASEKSNAETMRPTHFPSGVEINMAGEIIEPITIRKKPVFKKERKLSSSSSVHDPVNHPKHYTEHPSGIECIQITEHMSFSLGNALKYIWRADLKNNAVEDLQKAVWYINREIEKRSK
jgi:hypothetical protein